MPDAPRARSPVSIITAHGRNAAVWAVQHIAPDAATVLLAKPGAAHSTPAAFLLRAPGAPTMAHAAWPKPVHDTPGSAHAPLVPTLRVRAPMRVAH